MAKRVRPSDPDAAPPTQRRGRVSQSDVPRHTLDEALRIVTALSDQFAKKPTKPYYVADALNISPSSSRFRTLSGAAVAYGLTTGAYNSSEIALTPLGRRAVAPTVEGDDLQARREALLKPRVIREFLERYHDSPLPDVRIGRNVLEAEMGVDPDATKRTLEFIIESARSVGFLKEASGKTYVDLQATSTGGGAVAPDRPVSEEAVEEPAGKEPVETPEAAGPAPPAAELKTNRRVFITHGRNRKIVDQLKELLTFGDFEPVVSVERESVSKPVPEKVLDDMRSCAAAVIHVGTDQLLMDNKGNEQRVINANVLIEIGAAMMRYGGRFILLVEQGTTLPSNLQGLYEVRYEGDELDYPATMKLLKAFNEFKG
jgi:predicted nucleotide-binding protein